jgi:hypothetical protein
MPLVISEIVIRGEIGAPRAAPAQTEAERRAERARIVEEAVDEVLRALRRREEP